MKCLKDEFDLLRCGALIASTAEMSEAGVVGSDETATLSTRGDATCGEEMGAMATPLEREDFDEEAPIDRDDPIRLRRSPAGDGSEDVTGRG